jgi:hypothetical protein
VKKIYSLFGPLLTALLGLNIILISLIGIYMQFIFQCTTWGINIDLGAGKPILRPPHPWHQNLIDLLGKFLWPLILINFIVSLIYFIVGCVRYLFTLRQKEKRKDKPGKIMVLRGVLGIVILVILYLIIQLIAPVCL